MASLFATLILASCVPKLKPTYSQTSGQAYSPKPPNCNFRMQATPPDPSVFEEIGIMNGMSGTNDILRYQKIIAEQVCSAGGDLVVGEVNGAGYYCRGRVYKYRGPAQPQPGPQMYQPAPPAAPTGCGNDMDCKGDRVCVNGACATPDAP